MANPILTQIELPSGSVYDLHDSRVDNLNNWEYVVCTQASDTPQGVTWESGGTTITGTLVASADTMYKIYLVPDTNGTNDIFDEYFTANPSGSTYQWELFGSTKLPDMTQYVKNKTGHSGGTAGELAYKDSASGTVDVPKTYTTTVSTNTTSNVNITGTGVRLETDSQVMTGASFSGSSMTSTGNFTPSGTIGVGSGTANYTPAGSVSAPTVSLDASGTTTIKNPTSKTVVTDMDVAAPSATAATGELVYCEVSGTKLTLKKFVETTGASISTSNVTVVKGAATWTASQPSFTGTGAELTFSGTQGSVSVTGTTTGSVTPTKSNVTVSPAASGTATYTPAGTVAVPSTYTASTTTATTESKTVTVT